MVYFPDEIFKIILDYADNRIEIKQKQLHRKTCDELIEYFKIDADLDYAYFIYSLYHYHTDMAGNLVHNEYGFLENYNL